MLKNVKDLQKAVRLYQKNECVYLFSGEDGEVGKYLKEWLLKLLAKFE